MKTFDREKTILTIIRFGAVIPTLIFPFLITYTIITQLSHIKPSCFLV